MSFPARRSDSHYPIVLVMYLISVALSSIFNLIGYLFDNSDHRALLFACEEIRTADLRP